MSSLSNQGVILFHHKLTTEDDGWLIDVMVFITIFPVMSVMLHIRQMGIFLCLKGRVLPECAYATSLENQRCFRQWLPGPAHGKSTQNMAVRNNKDIALGVIRVLEARTLVFVSDFVDQSVKAANDVLGGSGRRGMNVSMR